MKLGNLLRYMGALSSLIQLTSCVAGNIDQMSLTRDVFQFSLMAARSMDLRGAGEKNLPGF